MANLFNHREFYSMNYPDTKTFLEENEFVLNFFEFKKYIAACQFLEMKGMHFTTKFHEAKRGLIIVMDLKTMRKFSLTEIGYIRTYVKSDHLYLGTANYQLNPKVNSAPSSKWGQWDRVLFPKEYHYMAKLLMKSVKRIRKNAGIK